MCPPEILSGHHPAGTVLPVGLISDKGDVHIGVEANYQSFRCRSGTICDYEGYLLQIHIGVRYVLIDIIPRCLICVFCIKIRVEIIMGISVILHQGRAVNLRLKNILSRNIGIRGDERGKLTLCFDEAASVVAQVKNKLLYSIGLELPEHIRKGLHRLDIKRVINQISDLLASHCVCRVKKDGILPHIHRLETNLFLHRTKIAVRS